MAEFATKHDGREIIFTDEGIRYDGRAFIRYSEMSDVTFRAGMEHAIIFRYKGRLVKLPFNGDDAEEIKKYFEKPEPPAPEAPVQELTDKFNYLDVQGEAPQEEKPKKSKVGLIIGLLVVAAIAVALVIFLL